MKPEMTIPEKEANLKKDKKTSIQSKAADKINLSPKLQEASGRTAVLVWGRMNPPTIGHEKLVRKQLQVARSMGATPILLLSHSEDAAKNPLPYDDKLFLAKKAFGNHVQKSPARTVIEALKHVDKDFDNVVLLCGSDRVKDYERVMGYNGKDFKFDSTKVMSAGQRDPDAEGAEGMSASKMRKAVKDGDDRAFKSGLPPKLKAIADQVYEMVKNGMKLAEMYMEEELLEVLSIQQRRKRGIQMRRYKTRIARARKIARKRMATKDKLVRRAQKAARNLVRKRVAGQRGTKYASLTVADKMNIDRRVEQRKSLIQKLAKRLMPAIRKAEMVRLKKARGYNVTEQLDIAFEQYFVNSIFEDVSATKEKHKREKEQMAVKHAREIQRAKIADVKREECVIDMQEADIFKLVDYMLEKIEDKGEHLDEKVYLALEKKADKSGIDITKLQEVYKGGVEECLTEQRTDLTPQQLGFARVNAFVARGKIEQKIKDVNDLFEAVEIGKDAAKKYAKDTPNQKIPVTIAVDGVPQAGGMIKKPDIDINEMFEQVEEGKKPGLWDNIHKKRARIKSGSGEKMRKPGSKGAPTAQDFKDASENFMDGKNPEDKGDMARHGLKGKSVSDLKKVRSSDTASPRKKQLAHWYINMQKGKKK
jgi:hypothetical protein